MSFSRIEGVLRCQEGPVNLVSREYASKRGQEIRSSHMERSQPLNTGRREWGLGKHSKGSVVATADRVDAVATYRGEKSSLHRSDGSYTSRIDYRASDQGFEQQRSRIKWDFRIKSGREFRSSLHNRVQYSNNRRSELRQRALASRRSVAKVDVVAQTCTQINKTICTSHTARIFKDFFEEKRSGFNEVNMATWLHRSAKLKGNEKKNIVDFFQANLDSINVEIQRHISKFTPQHIANIAWAFGKLEIKNEGLFALFTRELKSRGLRDFNSQGISNIAWAFGKLEIKDEGLFTLFAAEVKRRGLRGFQPQHIANTLCAFGKLGIKDVGLFTLFAAEVKNRGLGGFIPQDISNIAWAFGKLEIKDEGLFTLFAAEVKSRGLRGFQPQHIANTLCAFGKLGIKDVGLFTLFAAEVKSRGLGGFIPQDISNIAWAFGKLEIQDEGLFTLFAAEVKNRGLRGFQPQHIANTLCAFGKLGIKDVGLFTLFAAEVKNRGLRDFNSQDTSNILWAFGKLEIKNEDLFALFTRELKSRGLRDFNPQNIANTLWAFATLGIKDEGLFTLFAAEVKSRGLRDFNSQDTANILWAFAAYQVCFGLPTETQDFVKDLAIKFFNEFPQISYQDIHALLQVSYIFKLPDMIRKLEKKYLGLGYLADVSSSKSQKRVKNSLLSADVFLQESQIKEEHQLLIGLRTDLYIGGMNLVIEFDGPTHYFIGIDRFGNITYEATPKTKIRNHLITKVASANLIVVPFYEWGRSERPKYLKEKIDKFKDAYIRTPDDV